MLSTRTGLSPILPAFPDRSGSYTQPTGLIRVRSPLLAESRLISFPPGTEMFQFPGFASSTYEFSAGYSRSCGFPHSEIVGSKPVRSSPTLIAAYHVLHRLSMPRHPPIALIALDLSSKPVMYRDQKPELLNLAMASTLASTQKMMQRPQISPQTHIIP